jgi:hypothetical protein
MKLITAHKILITSATIFFGFFALWEANRYFNGDHSWALVRNVVLRRCGRFRHLPEEPDTLVQVKRLSPCKPRRF